MTKMNNIQWWGLTVACAVIVSGCASTRGDYEVPVVDRNVPASSGQPWPSSHPGNVATIEVPEGGHVVRKGDTLYNIAMRYGLTPRELAELNQLPDPNHINLGQVLKVSRKPSASSHSVEVPAASSTDWGSRPRSSEIGDVNGVEVKPLNPDGAVVETTKVESKSTVTYPANAASKQPYSEYAWQSAQDDGERLDFIWPTTGKIIQNFSNSNKGIDIAGKSGQAIMASASGKVVYVGSKLRGYGNLVILKHSKQFLTTYAHNREIVVREGEEVNRGQKIAEMGNTDSDQVKLHFEVRKLGKPVDPIKYLPER